MVNKHSFSVVRVVLVAASFMLFVLPGCQDSSESRARCGDGTYEQNGVCLALEETTVCGPGTLLQGTECRVGPCPAGSTAVDGACVSTTTESNCGPGTQLNQEGLCVATNSVTCGLGTLLIGSMCIRDPSQSIDLELAATLSAQGVTTLDPGNGLPMSDPKVQLGQALFFDKILSGNKDISCATCHHPLLHTGDGLPVSIGTGGKGMGRSRQLGEDRGFIPRNAPELFNRGSSEWNTMFWDNRVSQEGARFYTPADEALLGGLDSVLAAQALFPPTSNDEMRGEPGENEIADAEGVTEIWVGLYRRLMENPKYVAMFRQAYPAIEPTDGGFYLAANAIAAFEISAFTRLDSPFDRYLAGEFDAMSLKQKRGAVLFYGKAACSSCHSGSLMTDQETHSIASPQVGPGKGDEAPTDHGRFRETSNPDDMFAFRTPPLRNVALTGPWMHAGAYTNLTDAVVHHANPEALLLGYDRTQLPEALQDTVLDDDLVIAELLESTDALLDECEQLNQDELGDLMAFLHALTSPSSVDMSNLVPETVPSGLSVND